jgi:hypothetical protein
MRIGLLLAGGQLPLLGVVMGIFDGDHITFFDINGAGVGVYHAPGLEEHSVEQEVIVSYLIQLGVDAYDPPGAFDL